MVNWMPNLSRSLPVFCAVMTLSVCLTACAGHPWYHLPAKDKCDMKRSGWANMVHKGAICSFDEKYKGYYVGGGSAFIYGEPRQSTEGTFGVDYAPWYSRVNLGWNHGSRYQGGAGSYGTDHANNPFENFIQNRHR